MRAVFVDLYSSGGVGPAIGVAGDMRTAFDHQNALAIFRGDPFRDGGAVESGADDEQIKRPKIHSR